MAASKTRRTTYVKRPKLTHAGHAARVQAVLQVQAGVLSVSEAARRLGLSRHRFQTLSHRALAALAQALLPHKRGRKKPSDKERRLQKHLERERAAKQRAQRQALVARRLLQVARETLRAQARAAKNPRTPRSTTHATTAMSASPDEHPEASTRAAHALEEVARVKAAGLTHCALAAAAVGVSAPTLRRWAARRRDGAPAVQRRGPHARASRELSSHEVCRQQVEQRVRDTHGLVGAAALAHAASGLSRRTCAALKAQVLTQLERERQAACARVTWSAPGLVRGLDALHVRLASGEMAYLLALADAACPYLTGLPAAPAYTGEAVARALDEDFDRYGPPLCVRLDRAACHSSPAVVSVLESWRVLLLQGPPYSARYYGQLERINRDVRAWLQAGDSLSVQGLTAAAGRLQHALNALWPRAALGWRTPREVWHARPALQVDRLALADEVQAVRARLLTSAQRAARPVWWPARMAVEIVMQRHGWLARQPGGGC